MSDERPGKIPATLVSAQTGGGERSEPARRKAGAARKFGSRTARLIWGAVKIGRGKACFRPEKPAVDRFHHGYHRHPCVSCAGCSRRIEKCSPSARLARR